MSFPGKDREEMLQTAIAILQDLVARHPEVPDYRYLLARCYRETPPPPFTRNSQAAADHTRKATEILEKLVEDYPDVPDYRYDLSETYATLDARRPFDSESNDRDDEQRARESLEKALAISEELVAEHPNIPDYLTSQVRIRMRLTDLLWQSDPSRAEANLRKARDTEAALVRHFPQNSSYKIWMAVIDESLGRLLQQREQLPEARTTLEEGIALLKEVVENDPKKRLIPWMLAENYRNLADLLRSMNNYEAAAEADRQAEELRKTEEGARPPFRRGRRD
jgi:tetratricopeptide (TPR) repeat protein